jgi:uncharacterized protein YuzE
MNKRGTAMKINYDNEVDALLIQLHEGLDYKTIEVIKGLLYVHLDEAGQAVSIECLAASRYIEEPEAYQRSEERFLSVEEMAAMHNMSANNLQIILRKDQAKPESERRIAGAFKDGDERRGNWRIPLTAAQAFQKSKQGRPMIKTKTENRKDSA